MNMKTNYFLLLLFFAIFSCKNVVEIPLAEHPRPDFERAVWQNLNGYWQFQADSANVGLTEN